MTIQKLRAREEERRARPENAMTALYRRYRPALLSFFMRRVADPGEAEDLTQDVFAHLAASPRGATVLPEGYVFRSAANLLRDRARREKVRAPHRADGVCVEEAGADARDPARVLAGRQALDEVAEALERLPARTRAIFLQFRLENLSQAEIARRYGISVSAVQKHLLRAMTQLADRLDAMDMEEEDRA